ncbi:hypothetical protein [Thiohalomonas denitrificans]|uniref:Uncharacterized protein n=1 Tax=Thiohalomonas denitrificans TaxID=415747 RepID=A0A1G5QSY2_9GAMM|nr:hypothetical protein [Thiohalomonas denitrificans]SCZ64852.1 hypothetical protein SAMN03097708_02716 [Thiohalomonas denitrificans]
MGLQAEETIVDKLLTHLPHDLCHSIDDGLIVAGERAYRDSAHRHEGHISSFLGQARHFHSNEQFAFALDMAGIEHNPVRGNDIIIGQLGPLLLGRFATSSKTWNNAKRSKRRLDLASHNQWVERLFQPDMFGIPSTGPTMAVFFVSVFSGSVRVQPERPLSVEISVMNTMLSERLFSEPLTSFVTRYAQPAEQRDIAQVRLKQAVMKDGKSSS